LFERSACSRSLLLGDTESSTGSASGLSALTSDLESPEVTETSVLASLLHALQILSETSVDHVGDNVAVSTFLGASLSVQEPHGNAVLSGLGEDVTDGVHLLLAELTGSAVEVDSGNFADEDRHSSADTFDDSEGKTDLVLAVNIGVLHSQNVLEISCFLQNEG